jgi:ribosomal protein S18 acetylase RimI-like enzyme
MGVHPLGNPVWYSLTTEQRSLAIGTDDALRYPGEIAPFVAVENDGERGRAAALELVAPGETVFFVAVAPRDLDGWEILGRSRVLQMMWNSMTTLPSDRSDIVALSAPDAPAMLELTALAFPGFFRRRTRELGHYCGIRVDGALVSMAGERMRATGHQEISGVCTHPNHTGRGYSAKLNAYMIESICARGVRPFLHVSSPNTRAIALYRRLGFVERIEMPMWHVRRR